MEQTKTEVVLSQEVWSDRYTDILDEHETLLKKYVDLRAKCDRVDQEWQVEYNKLADERDRLVDELNEYKLILPA